MAAPQDLDRLHAELAEVKQLVVQLVAQQLQGTASNKHPCSAAATILQEHKVTSQVLKSSAEQSVRRAGCSSGSGWTCLGQAPQHEALDCRKTAGVCHGQQYQAAQQQSSEGQCCSTSNICSCASVASMQQDVSKAAAGPLLGYSGRNNVTPAEASLQAAGQYHFEPQHQSSAVSFDAQRDYPTDLRSKHQHSASATDICADWSIGSRNADFGYTCVRTKPSTYLSRKAPEQIAERVQSDNISTKNSIWLNRSNQTVGQQPNGLWCQSTGTALCSALKACLWDVLLPQGLVLVIWDFIMLISILYLCFVLPYAIAFDIDFGRLTHPLAVLDLIMSGLFLADVAVNFRISFVGDDGRLVTDRRRIAKRYLEGWFAFDLVSSLPYEQIIGFGAGTPAVANLLQVTRAVRVLKVLRLLKLLRVARVLRLQHVIPQLEAAFGRVAVQLVTMAGSMILLLHWAACVWCYVALVDEFGNTWVKQQKLQAASYTEVYITSLYWSVTTLATVGYGDIVGHSIGEKVVAMVAMLMGASVFGYFMGAMAVVFSTLHSNGARMASKRQAVDNFLKHRKLPKVLAGKVRSYYHYVTEHEVQADEADIIAGLSASLRTQVVLHLYQEALEKVPYFKGQDPHFITSIVTYLKLEYYAPGDIVVRQGDLGPEMYFIAEGVLEARIYEDDTGSPLPRAAYRRSTAHRRKARSGKADLNASTASDSLCQLAASEDSTHMHQHQQSQRYGPELASQGSNTTATSTSDTERPLLAWQVVGQSVRAASRLASYIGLSLGNSGNGKPCKPSAPTTTLVQKPGHISGSRSSGEGAVKGIGSGTPDSPGPSIITGAGMAHAHGSKNGDYKYPLRVSKASHQYTYVDELGSRKYRHVEYLRPGGYFGEHSCLSGTAHASTIVATTYCELYSLSRADLEEVLQQWPLLAERFEAMVKDAQMFMPPSPMPPGRLTRLSIFSAGAHRHSFGKTHSSMSCSEQLNTSVQPHEQQYRPQEHIYVSADDVGLSPAMPVAAMSKHTRQRSAAASPAVVEHMAQQQDSKSPNAEAGAMALSACSSTSGVAGLTCNDAGAAAAQVPTAASSPSKANSESTELPVSRPKTASQMEAKASAELPPLHLGVPGDKLLVTAASTTSAGLCEQHLQALTETVDLSRHSHPIRQTSSLARQSHPELSKTSSPPVLRRSAASLSRRSPAGLSRPSNFIPGCSSGLFQPSNQGYIFPAAVNRHGALVSQASPATSAATGSTCNAVSSAETKTTAGEGG